MAKSQREKLEYQANQLRNQASNHTDPEIQKFLRWKANQLEAKADAML